ncbi:MAG: alpha-2-macroglobulin [Marinilabiliaceae bacterium]|nr:alpha-2-macroglobulin [Marinilabiliaceae bacterium]
MKLTSIKSNFSKLLSSKTLKLIVFAKLIKLVIAATFLLWFNNSCTSKKETKQEIIYNAKISAFTSGIVSSQSVIRVEFSSPVASAEPGMPADKGILKTSPGIDGDLIWDDKQTLIFQPAERLKSGKEYIVKIDLPSLFNDEKENFEFNFQVIQQLFRYEAGTIRPENMEDLSQNSYSGTLFFADYEELEKIEKIITVTQKGEKLPLEWDHSNETHSHSFKAKGVIRGESANQIIVSWDGDVIDVDMKGSETVNIPSIKDFSILDVKTIKYPSSQVIITFSDPLLKNQLLNGLITINKQSNLKYQIDANNIIVYPPSGLLGTMELKIFPGIKNILGFEYENQASYNIHFEIHKPEIKFIGKGTILPNSQGLILPFKAVSLRAVEVSIIKIFENNIASFLQVNHLDGNEQLRRAGMLIKKKTILLDTDKTLDLSNWNTFSIDLASIINPDPGAIYRVELNMHPNYSIYPCQNGNINTNEPIEDNGITEDDIAYWDQPYVNNSSSWDNQENYYYSGWNSVDNPCYVEYYKNKKISRNILSSDIGIIVKGGNDKKYTVATSELSTSNIMSDVDIEILSYQNQIIGKGKTGSDGLTSIDVKQKPYLLIAKKGSQRGYLRLNDGSALSVSRFDVSGQTIKEGLKGYIYGDRGVWRPGDTLFISFMLEDKLQSLPQNHPIIFELINPYGQIHSRQMASLNNSGLYSFRTVTSESSPTGNWGAVIQVGGAMFEKSLRIETIKPNRLKIEFDFNQPVIKKGDEVTAKLKSKWLHGAIAKNLAADIRVTLNQDKTSFKNYPDYIFDDPSIHFDPEEMFLFDGKLNEEGIADVTVRLETSNNAPGMLKASFLTRVYEESGDFSVDRFTIPYASYETFVGIKTPKGDKRGMLLTDTTHTVSVVTVNGDGKPVTSTDLIYRIYKVNWRWWWESSDDDLARYMGSTNRNLVSSGKINCLNGKGSFKFNIKYPSWGRYLIWVSDENGGHSVGKTVYVDWPGWALKPTDNPQEASMLTFSADKEKYSVGEEVKLTFPSPGSGRALISLETGTKVIKAWWVETQKGVTNTTFTATEDMTPNIYANITLIQPHQHSDNDLPIRLYGIAPIMIENPQTILSPVLIMPEEMQPEEETTIQVKEAGKNKMTYTIAVVDEGLLDLTRFKTPNPWHSFYAKEALGIKTWDLYNYVMGAYGGKMERAFSLGGDDEMSSKQGGQKVNRFKPMVKFFGPFILEGGKTATHKFKVPLYIGSVRTMVVACNNGAYGSAEATTPVRKPVMTLATLPRVLGPGEKVKLPVTVFAMTKDVKTVNVSIEVEGPIKIEGLNKTKVNFDSPGDQIVTFDLSVNEAIGKGKIKIIAKAGKNIARDEIEVAIRNPNPPVSSTVESVIKANETANIDYVLPGIVGTNNAVVEISSIPPIDFGRRLEYLIKYPHGCIEQTTSAVFPQLFLADVVELRAETREKTDHNIRKAIYKLKQFVLPDGGFSYWPNQSEPNEWGTSYGGHFLLEAEKKGYTPPIGWKKKWIKYQKQASRRWTNGNSTNYHSSHKMLDQAYRLYTLALAGEPDMSAMNRLRNEPKLTVYAKWRLAAAYTLAGQSNVAMKIIENLPNNEEIPDNYYDYTFGSDARNTAMIIETLSLLGKYEMAMPLISDLSKMMSSEKWMSTQTTAYSLLAISKFLNANSSKEKGMQFSWSHNGKEIGSYNTILSIYQDSIILTNKKDGTVSITNKSNKIIYARVAMRGTPAVGEETTTSSNLKLTVEYLDMNGHPVNDISKLEQGTDFMASIIITHTGILSDYKNLVLSQIFPSGWEIRNTRLENIQSAYETNQADYRDIRDDRVYSYFDLKKSKSIKLVVLLNAAYKGTYYLPAVSCEAQYDNSINASVPGKWVTVE